MKYKCKFKKGEYVRFTSESYACIPVGATGVVVDIMDGTEDALVYAKWNHDGCLHGVYQRRLVHAGNSEF